MNTRVLVLLALFVGIGAVLHAVVPGFFFGMKPDMMLTMMFLGILLFPNKKAVGLLAVATGIISGMTTSFPGGFVPNIIDKLVTAFLFFTLLLIVKKRASSNVTASLLTAIGTVISGVVFLTAALLIVGLPGGTTFSSLFVAVVLPATVVNTIVMIVLYPIVQSIFRRAKLAVQQ
jgi:hypothetical protein